MKTAPEERSGVRRSPLAWDPGFEADFWFAVFLTWILGACAVGWAVLR